jgi:hypothetical protein
MLLCAGLALLGAAVARPAAAATVTGTYVGRVDRVDAPLAGQFTVGDHVTINFSYDTSTPDTDGDPTSGNYESDQFAGSGAIGSYLFTGNGNGGVHITDRLNIDYHGDFPNVDSFEFTTAIAAPDIGGYSPRGVDTTMIGTTALFSSDALPTSFIPQAAFKSGSLVMVFRDAFSNFAYVHADMSPTPLPGALPLFAAAVGLLGFGAWRRRVAYRHAAP